MSKKIRVILADDHPIVHLGIKAELEKLSGVEVVGEAVDGRQAIELVKQHRPDVVFMDISMPGMRGIEATARITGDFPDVRVIILSTWGNEEYYWGAIKAGASGYLLKKTATNELRKALERVCGGEIFLSREVADRMVRKFPSQHIVHSKGPL